MLGLDEVEASFVHSFEQRDYLILAYDPVSRGEATPPVVSAEGLR